MPWLEIVIGVAILLALDIVGGIERSRRRRREGSVERARAIMKRMRELGFDEITFFRNRRDEVEIIEGAKKESPERVIYVPVPSLSPEAAELHRLHGRCPLPRPLPSVASGDGQNEVVRPLTGVIRPQ